MFGRWVCTSGCAADLQVTDNIALSVMETIKKRGSKTKLNKICPFLYVHFYILIGHAVSDLARQQYEDNVKWIQEASSHKLVVGSQARILYSNEEGRRTIAQEFNKAIANGKIRVACDNQLY